MHIFLSVSNTRTHRDKIRLQLVAREVELDIMYTMRARYFNIKSVSLEQIQRKENDQARLMQVLHNFKPHYTLMYFRCSLQVGDVRLNLSLENNRSKSKRIPSIDSFKNPTVTSKSFSTSAFFL